MAGLVPSLVELIVMAMTVAYTVSVHEDKCCVLQSMKLLRNLL